MPSLTCYQSILPIKSDHSVESDDIVIDTVELIS